MPRPSKACQRQQEQTEAVLIWPKTSAIAGSAWEAFERRRLQKRLSSTRKKQTWTAPVGSGYVFHAWGKSATYKSWKPERSLNELTACDLPFWVTNSKSETKKTNRRSPLVPVKEVKNHGLFWHPVFTELRISASKCITRSV